MLCYGSVVPDRLPRPCMSNDKLLSLHCSTLKLCAAWTALPRHLSKFTLPTISHAGLRSTEIVREFARSHCAMPHSSRIGYKLLPTTPAPLYRRNMPRPSFTPSVCSHKPSFIAALCTDLLDPLDGCAFLHSGSVTQSCREGLPLGTTG